ncbi:hypothetical protein H0E87_014065 [Populus deltoides]|uniref:Uncharacterized protein n=1 Tax=Populus deltoides TaxID=3696 RepID=A0A8T2YBS4_POPDE|nr:hypothetical protein H0E87_014065 [Populus deltoides]
MSGSARNAVQKWDLKEGSRMSFEDVEDNTWPGKAGISFRDKESRRDWLPPEAAGGTRSKWSAMEPLPGRRSLARDDNIDEDPGRTLKATYEDESYGTRMSPCTLSDTAICILVIVLFFQSTLAISIWCLAIMEPAYDAILNKLVGICLTCPVPDLFAKAGARADREPSRSPVHGFGESERMKELEAYQVYQLNYVRICCWEMRRGSHCPFLHQDTETCEDDWERRPRKAAASKYPISMILSSTQWGVEDLLIAVMSF